MLSAIRTRLAATVSRSLVTKAALSTSATRCIDSNYSLPSLSYSLDALEPTISKEIMSLHYNGHHQTYVDNANKFADEFNALDKAGKHDQKVDVMRLLHFNIGGHINHTIFWDCLAPKGKGGGEFFDDTEDLKKDIEKTFGSVEALKEKMNKQGAGIMGSGWVWLGLKDNKLDVFVTANQDPLDLTWKAYPLLGIDCWEHAYYLQYTNKRVAYLQAMWDIVNWRAVSTRYLAKKTNPNL